MQHLLLIAALALLNRLRGHDFGATARWRRCLDAVTSKALTSLYSGLAAWWYFAPLPGLLPEIAGMIVGLGIYLWALPGWGEYLAAVDGIHTGVREIAIIDWLGKVLVREESYAANRLRGMMQMSLRGLLLLPLYLGLAYALGRWGIFPLGLAVCLLQGPCYYLAREVPEPGVNAVPVAELVFGALIGASLFLTRIIL